MQVWRFVIHRIDLCIQFNKAVHSYHEIEYPLIPTYPFLNIEKNRL